MDRNVARSPFKNYEYFDFTIAYNDQIIAKFRQTIAHESTTPRHRQRLTYSLYQRSVEQVIARYSRGDAVEGLILPFQESIIALESYRAQLEAEPDGFRYLGSYITSLWLVSLAVLLKVEDDLFRKLVFLIANKGCDRIFEQLVASRIDCRCTDAPILHPKQYRLLGESLDADTKVQPRLIQEFLENYYENMAEVSWCGTHLRSDKSFFGYWSFEAAAIVKVMNIPDSSFRSNVYYPKDLVHR